MRTRNVACIDVDSDDLSKHQGREIKRVVGAYSENDLLYATDIPVPVLLGLRERYHRAANLMVQYRDGSWLGLLETSIGYTGNGPDSARRALMQLGLEPGLVERVVSSRFSDVDLDDIDNAVFTARWPRFWLPSPVRQNARVGPYHYFFVYRVGSLHSEPNPFSHRHMQTDPDGGFFPVPRAKSSIEACIEYLDTEPLWVDGCRSQRVGIAFTHRKAAQDAGFAYRDHVMPRQHTVSAVIEQGRVQVWIETPFPDGRQDIHDETYRAFDMAGLSRIQRRSFRSTLRFPIIRRLLPRPASVGFSGSSGASALTWTPISDPEHQTPEL